ncbi:MAG: TspO/MBR family protein [Bacteroidota bacterium]
MKKFFKLSLCILLPLLVGAVGGFATTSSIQDWYLGLNKPTFNPPNYLFGPVWTTLYILMGISFYLIIEAPASQIRKKAVGIFIIQLFLNFWWSFIFFKYHLLGLALVEIITMWLTIAAMIYVFQKINKTAAYLQIPYLLWVSFASVLNGAIWYLNN